MLLGLMLLIATAVIMAEATRFYIGMRRHNDLRHLLLTAAESELAAMRVGVDPSGLPHRAALPSHTDLTVDRTAGVGPWHGLTRVTVTATKLPPSGKPVELRVIGYIREDGP